MDLIDKIKKIAEMEGVDKSELILEEATFFMEEHEGHGHQTLMLEYEAGRLSYIGLYCASNCLEECSQNLNSDLPDVIAADSIIYAKKYLYQPEIENQRERREFIKSHGFLNQQ